MLYALLRELCPHAGLTYFGLDEALFAQDSFSRPLDVGSVFVDRGYCYGGFRCFPLYPVPILDSAKTIWLVRDPRDMLVSHYFSLAQSHVMPSGEPGAMERFRAERERARTMSPDDWVSENYAWQLLSLEGYFAQGFTRRSNVAIYRYEDVIFRKKEWLSDIVAWYGWDVPAGVIGDIAARHDIVPDAERPAEHVRQVRPGNYRAHLTEDTLSRVEPIFRHYMQALGYE